jgi:hypothetical protein
MDENQTKIVETERRLGALAMAFSGVDIGLEKIFLALAQLQVDVGGVLFHSHEGTARRRELVDKLAKHVLKTKEELLARWTTLRDEHKEIHARRNKFIHHVWAVNPQDGTFSLVKHGALSATTSFDEMFSKVDDAELSELATRARNLMRNAILLSIDIADSHQNAVSGQA